MLNALKSATNVTYTENNAKVYKTTESHLLDLFSQGGALRNRSEDDIISLFSKALHEDKLLAMKMLFYFRDVRGGQGERQTFRTLINYLANNHSELIEKNLYLVSHFGRWDDLYSLIGTALEGKVFDHIKYQLELDKRAGNPSLLAKWLKSENTSSYESRRLATKTRKALGLSSREYRKTLSSLRKKIDVVESLMSAKEWDQIEYSKVPSQASLNYRDAFRRNDEERYEQYLESLKKGETKINTGTLFPYEIVRQVQANSWNSSDETLDLMWDNLPDYIGGSKENSIAVVDVSGSMMGLPMEVAISVGMYLAERNEGAFQNHFITFSNRPEIVEIVGDTLHEKVRNMERANWDMNTNIKAVFDLILDTAIRSKISQNEMVKKLYIISDMEFDEADSRADEYLFEVIRDSYRENGYEMPQLVFWNVNARNSNAPMTMNHYGVQFVSGCSPSIFQNLMKGEFMSAYDLMLDVLNDERYDAVTA